MEIPLISGSINITCNDVLDKLDITIDAQGPADPLPAPFRWSTGAAGMKINEIPASDLYDDLARGHLATEQSRKRLAELSVHLADSVSSRLSANGIAPRSALCVFILRGGALLLPGFLQHMAGSPFCLLAMKRGATVGTAEPIYCSDLPVGAISTIIYVDCIAASGGTVDAARALMRESYHPEREILVVVASSADATHRFAGEGVEVFGVSLYERIEGGVLAPDLGRLDAGDILSGVRFFDDKDWSLVS